MTKQYKTHHHIQIILLLHQILSKFHLSTHNRNPQIPITRRNHQKIQIPRASPDTAVEHNTIQQMERPPDEPTESGKPRATDEKRLARIPTNKESWNAQQKKFHDSDGNPPVAFSKTKRREKTTHKKNYNKNYNKK